MEAHHRLGGRLIDGAILLLSLALVVWVGLIVVASGTRMGETNDPVSAPSPAQAEGQTPAQGKPAGPFRGARGHAEWKLAWHDEFNGARCPSRAKWSFEKGFVRNGELQWYQPQNAYCRDGALILEARSAEKLNPSYRAGSTHWRLNRRVADYTSASIASKYSFTYGRAEGLIRIDTRAGSWPAFWTLSTRYGGDPRAWPATGEVDIMEYYRDLVLANVCNPKPTWCGWSSTRQSLAGLGGHAWADRFHVWAMDWNSRHIDLFLDGKRVHRFAVTDATHGGRKNPYVNRPALLLLSQAIGGANGGHPTGTKFPVRLEVKYVRVYQRAGDERRGAVN